MEYKEIHFLNQSEANLLVNTIKTERHKCLILLMLDAGLRVSEAISLRFSNFDFPKKTLSVNSLKKRGFVKKRKIPLSQRLIFSLAEYVKEFHNVTPDSWLFPNPINKEKHITRDSVCKYLRRLSIKKLNIPHLHPHALRHSFATSLITTGSNLPEIADLLGHEKLDTTRIYAHIPQERLRQSVRAAAKHNGDRRKWYNFLISKRPPQIYIPNNQSVNITVGRNKEFCTICENVEKGTNVILLGAVGTGKRTILDGLNFKGKKILTFDDTASIKKSLIYMLIYLYDNDKEAVAKLLFNDFDRSKLETKLSRQSVGFLCDKIIEVVQPKEYVLKIKQIDGITPQTMKVIERLKDTFVIITSAVEVSINKSAFLWNFEKVELKNLTRNHAFELIHKLSYDLHIEDYEVFRNHIYQQTNGNPRAIVEMIERYRREPVLISSVVRSITHYGAIKEFDCSYAVVIMIASLAIFRYMTSEFDNPGLRVIGGMAMILLLLSRSFFAQTKRKLL